MAITENESETLKLKIIMELLDNEKKKATEDDRIFRDRITGEITNRDNQYTRLLSHFVNITIAKADIQQLIDAIPLFITSIIGLVSAVIAIPIAITKYLFSTKEDKTLRILFCILRNMILPGGNGRWISKKLQMR